MKWHFSHFTLRIIKFNGFWNVTNYDMNVSLEINLFKLVCFQELLGWAELGDREAPKASLRMIIWEFLPVVNLLC